MGKEKGKGKDKEKEKHKDHDHDHHDHDKKRKKSDEEIENPKEEETKREEGTEKKEKKEKKDRKNKDKTKTKVRPGKKKTTAVKGSSVKSPEFIQDQEGSFDYNEDLIPPDFTVCENHLLARTCAPERDDDNSEVKNVRCKCCGYVVDREPLPLSCDFKQLGFLGVGFPLFFSYIQSCFIVLLIIFVISGAYNMGSSNKSSDCYTQDEVDFLVNQTKLYDPDLANKIQDKECVLAWVTRISLGNKRYHEEHLTSQRWLNLATIVVLIFYFQIMRRNQRKIDKDCDESNTTPGDYTVMVTNIKTGLGIDYDDELKAFFEENAIPGKKANIVSVNLGYNMNQKITLDRKKDAVVDKKQKALNYKNVHGKYPFFYNEKTIENQIKQYEAQIEAIDKEFQSGQSDKFCGIAFVTFETETEKEQCINTHFKSLRRRIYNYFVDHFKKALKTIDKNELFFYEQRIHIFEAPEPSDVYWENLHYTSFETRIRMIISELFSFSCLVGFAIGIYYLSLYQSNINNNSKTTVDQSENIKIKVIGTLISVCISLVIEVLKILIPMAARFEKKKTRTEYYTSVAVKLSIASFCTSSLITFIITATVFENYFGGSGLINNQIIVFITNLIIPFLVQFINFPYLWKTYLRNQERKKGKLSTMTQQEANSQLFQHPEFIIEKCYAQVAFTMIFTGFYATILPLGILFAMGTMFLLYWIYKYNLLRKSTVLYDIDSTLAYQMTDLLELTALAFAVSEFVFTKLIFDTHPLPSILCLAIAGANFILPTQWLNEKLFRYQVEPETKSYYDAEDDFDTDYLRENPATGEMAREDYERKEDEEQKLHKVMAT